MANSEAGSSSDAARALEHEYQVFLNFRGLDTRHGFTDFLYRGLVDVGVRVFRDEDELPVGEVIGGNLLRAINNSMIYIPIFSVTYASSKWCLRELVHIIDNVSQSENKKSILPIFFHVKPDDVKLKTPLYKDYLREHEEKFPVEVKAWRKALEEVDEIKGWSVKEDQGQATIVEAVVERVLEKLELKQRLVLEHLVGLDDQVKQLIELLDVNHRDVRLIGIYGMGGIGKTTIAEVVFNKLTSYFGKCCSFLEDVRENMSTKDGTVQLQKKLLFDIGYSNYAEGVKDSKQGMRRIGEVLSTKKVLVVLDDVDNEDHIKRLIGNNSLHSGSRIIITTRNKTILQGQEFKDKIIPYEILKMDDAPALELFCWHAFEENFPSDDYHRLSKEIVSSTGGLPLAVKVIGSLLRGQKESFWKETLVRLKEVPEEEILKKLRISYDDLDKYQQQIFLDIACFFSNEKKTNAIYMWESCQFYPEKGINVLTNRCLIKILDDDKFWMHDQLIDMGRQIVRQENPSDLGNQSRLWIAKEALEIKRTKERKDKVQALEIEGFGGIRTSITEITNEEFERFPNLRFLKLESVTFVGDFAECCSKLKWISLKDPCYFKANNMYLDDLVVFKLDSNEFKDDSKAWDLIKGARNLKVLSLIECHGITTIPNFSESLKLERFTLAKCRSLKKIEKFIGELQFLIELEIKECVCLTDLPKQVGALRKLRRFSLWGCCGLRELPSSLGNLTLLEELDLSYTRIRELYTFIEKLKSLRVLCFASRDSEEHAWHLLSGISMLVKLEELDLSGHNGMEGEIPIGIGELLYLRILNLACTSICKIPMTINKLHHLQTLDLSSCDKIQELPELPTSLTCLLFRSNSLRSVPNLSNLTNLVELQLVGGFLTAVEAIRLTGRNLSWIGRLSRLEKLNLKLQTLSVPVELASLSHLKELVLEGLDLRTFTQFPSSDWSGRNLSTLRLKACRVKEIRLVELPRLEHFSVIYCSLLRGLSLSSGLTLLRQVDVHGCERLVQIRVESLSKSLEDLIIESCDSLERISGLSCLKNLKRLVIDSCWELTDVEGLDELESLKSLTVIECNSLRRFIDASHTKIPDDCTLTIAECGSSIRDSRGMRLKYYREEILRNSSNKDEAERDVSSPDEDSDSASVDESEIDGNSSSDDFQSKPGNGECFEATESGSQTKDESVGHSGNVSGGKMTSMEYRKEEKDESGEPEDQNDVWSSWQRGEGVEHHESTCKATTEVEDEGDLFSLGHPFKIIFHLGVKKPSEWSRCFGGIERKNKNVTPDSVTYKGLIADVKGFGFCLKRMWYEIHGDLLVEIKSDEQVKEMVQLASKRRSIHLYVKGQVDSEWKGQYDDDMMEMLKEEWAVQTDVYSDDDGAELHVFSPDEDSDSEVLSESKTEGNFSIDDFQGKRDRTLETDRMPTKTGRGSGTGRASNPGRGPVERGRGRGIASSSGNSKGSRSGSDTASTSGKGKASNSRSIYSISRSSATLSSGRDMILSSGRGRGSSSRRDTTNMGTSSSSGRGIASSSRSSLTLSTGRGRGSTSGKGTTVSLGRDTTEMGASLRSGADKGSSNPRSSTTLSIGRGTGLTSKKGATVHPGRDATLSLGRGATEMGASSRSGTDKGLSSSKTKPQTSSS